jgi:outer membrane protein OmpA-like peptidoglycan-associated protein
LIYAKKLIFLGFTSILMTGLLAGCSGKRETIDVDKPQGAVVDLKSGEVHSFYGDSLPTNSGLHSLSSSNVQIFSLDDPAPDLRGSGGTASGAGAASAQRAQGYTTIGNSSVEIFLEGQPQIGYVPITAATNQYGYRSERPISSHEQSRLTGETGNFVNIATAGEPIARIYFEHDSAQLSESDVRVITELAQLYNTNRGSALSVEGHASTASSISDPVRRKEVNLKISMERAYSVARALMHSGVPAGAIRTVAWGEEVPASGNSAMDIEAASRRVEVFPHSR